MRRQLHTPDKTKFEYPPGYLPGVEIWNLKFKETTRRFGGSKTSELKTFLLAQSGVQGVQGALAGGRGLLEAPGVYHFKRHAKVS